MLLPFTVCPEIEWPAVPPPYAAGVLGVLFQLEQTQWLAPGALAEWQKRQLRCVVQHAYGTVPFYRERFDALKLNPTEAASSDGWRRVPFLTRRDIQLAGAALHSNAVPPGHGAVGSTTTGGSTGQPVTVLTTELTGFFWRVLTLRDHLWHHRDFAQTFAAIRHGDHRVGQPPGGTRLESWGQGTRNVVPTGPGYVMNVKSTIEEQADWLYRLNPGYILAYPSVLFAIAQLFEKRGCRLSQLREVATFGEVVDPECRSTCERVFGTKLIDMYSSEEVGYIAFQCPAAAHYHVQSENLLLEVVDDAGEPCRTGQIGKVVVTTLHNFAMPLVRYDIGDYAEVGEPCPCGRGLPVLKRILGRQRNLLVLPTGERRWPVFTDSDTVETLPPFFQFQVVQRTIDALDINVVRPTDSVTPEEHAIVERHFQRVLGYPFRIRINCLPEIPRSPTGKFEDFISLVE